MKLTNFVKYFLILSVIFFAGCPNTMIGLGDKVDIDAPTVSIGKYGDGSVIVNGDYVRGEVILTGSASDDIGIQSVKLSFDGGLTFFNATVSSDQKSWSYTVDTAAFEDGEKDIIVLVSDTSASPKTSEERLLLYFDNTPPVVVVKSPVGYADNVYSNSILNLKGEAADPFRIRNVDVELMTGEGVLSSVDGTNSWSAVFTSQGTGTYSFKVTAEDYAGNRSTHFYHYDDILIQNSNVYITPEDVYRVENGEDISNLTKSELVGSDGSGGIQLSSVTYEIDMSADEPVIVLSNPDPNASADENILPGNSKAIGSVTDDDAVDDSSIEISIDDGSFVPVTTVSGSGQFVRWEHDLSSLGSGSHTLQVRSSDIYGVSKYSSVVSFFINLGAPEITITSPLMGSYKDTGNFNITGTAHDGESVTEIKISFDDGSTWNDISITPGTDVSWNYTTSGLADGVIPIKVKAFDGTSWSFSNLQVTVDTNYPITSFYSPSFESYVNGEVVIRGASSDNNSLLKTEIKVGNSRSWIELDDALKYNWTYTINSLEYENSTDATEYPVDSGIYKLNVYSRVTDIAGNVTTTTADNYYFYIDNALDRPTVNIVAPSNDVSLGGSVIVSGTSYDDDGEVHGVYMQIDVNTHSGDDPDFADSSVDLGSGNGIDFDGTGGNSAVRIIDETNWYLVDGKSPWNVELNTNGELYNTEAGHTGDIYIRVHAVDKDGGPTSITGEYKELHIRMDDTIPHIDNITPVTDSYNNQIFTITGSVIDETKIKHLEISYNGGADYHYIIRDSEIQSGYSGSGSVTTNYSLDLDVDTSNIPDVGSVTSDDITIRLKVTDSTNYQTLYSLHYYIDNQDPTGSITTDLSDINGFGSDSTISGTADDSGTVSGVDKVLAYFERSGTYYNPLDGTSTTTEPTDPADATYQIIIDSTTETLGGANSDGDGIAEELNIGSPYVWMFKFDSNNIDDGPVTLHYIVYDKSGNSASYTAAGYIKNHAPEIESITLGTDLNGISGIEGAEESTYFPAAFSATNFTGRNDQLKISINLASGSGNAPLNYSITYNGGSNLITSGAEALIDMSNHTIYADVDGNSAGFICTITDSAGLTTSATINMNIDNVDEILPTIEFGVLDVNSSVPESAGEKEGHLEERNWSNYDNGTGNDPDISGKIIFNGSAWDDQRIQNLYIWIDLNNDGDYLDAGEKILIADEDADGGLKNVNGNIISETLTELGGHNVSFTYEWDSASLTSITGNDINIKLVAEDYNSTPNANVEYSYPTANYNLMTVDVVPYISNIATSVTTAFSDVFSRSSSGRYPVRINSASGTFETIKVYGYNLNPAATGASSDVRLSLDPDALNPGKVGKGLTYGNIAAGYTSLDVSMEINGVGPLTGSGYLSIFTNGIPSINNINDNSVNSEADYINPNLSDDRYLSVWDLNLLRTTVATADSAVYPSMAMNGDTPVFAYVNNAAGYGRARYWDGSADKAIYNNWDLFTYTAVDLNSNGNHAVLYDINVVNGNYGDYNSGNYGGILTSFYYDVPSHNYYPDSRYFLDNHIWLDNLVDTAGLTTAVLDRYQHPDMVMNSTGTTSETRVFYTVYDRMTDRIIYRTYRIGTDATIDDSSGGRINNSGTALYTDLDQDNRNGDFPAYDGNNDNNARFISSNTTGASPLGEHVIDSVNTGDFSAVAATPDGSTVAIAYYDAAGTGNVRLKYNNDPTNSGTWIDVGIIDSGHGGENIDIQIDSNNNIHIAYYDNNKGDLRYIYLPKATADPTWVVGDVEKYIVDNYFDVGEKLTLELDGTNHPFIAYKGVNRSGKVAWLTGAPADGADSSEQFTGAWEIMILPTQITNSDSNKFCVGVDTNGLPVAGYTNGGIEYIRLLSDLID